MSRAAGVANYLSRRRAWIRGVPCVLSPAAARQPSSGCRPSTTAAMHEPELRPRRQARCGCVADPHPCRWQRCARHRRERRSPPDGSDGALRLHRPVLYQHINGEKKTLDGRYVLNDKRELSFALPAYDTRYPLVIDPVFKLLYLTYSSPVFTPTRWAPWCSMRRATPTSSAARPPTTSWSRPMPIGPASRLTGLHIQRRRHQVRCLGHADLFDVPRRQHRQRASRRRSQSTPPATPTSPATPRRATSRLRRVPTNLRSEVLPALSCRSCRRTAQP